MKQAQEAMQQANSPEMQEMMQQQGTMGAGAFQSAQQGMADRSAIEAQTHEFQRISAVGQPAKALIKRIDQTSESVSGLPVWEIDLEAGDVSRLVLHQLEPGGRVPVRVDSHDSSRLEFG